MEDLVGRESALVGVLTQRNAETVEPTFGDLYEVGTLARLVKVIRLGPSNYSVVLNGLGRFRVKKSAGARAVHARRDRANTRHEPRPRRSRASDPGPPGRDTPRDRADAESAQGNRRHPRQRSGAGRARGSHRVETFRKSTPASHSARKFSRLATFASECCWSYRVVERQLEVLRVKDEITSMVAEEMTRSQRDYRPAPADAHHPRGARRRRRRGRDRRASRTHRPRRAASRGGKSGQEAALAARRHAAAVGRVSGDPHLRGVARRPAVESHAPPIAST